MNNTLPALSVANVTVRQHDGLYSLNDLHKASGGAAKHEPNQFTRLDQTQALIAELSKSADLRNYIQTKRGKHNGGTFACRELVIAYAAWISAAFHLKVIRVFLDSVAAQRRIDETRPLTPAHDLCIITPARANSRAGFDSPMYKAQQRPSFRCPALFLCPPIGGGLLRSATRSMAGGAGRAHALPVPCTRSVNPASSATSFDSGVADSSLVQGIQP